LDNAQTLLVNIQVKNCLNLGEGWLLYKDEPTLLRNCAKTASAFWNIIKRLFQIVRTDAYLKNEGDIYFRYAGTRETF